MGKSVSRRWFIKNVGGAAAGVGLYYGTGAKALVDATAESTDRIYTVGRFYSDIAIPGADPVKRYLKIMPKEFQDKYNGAVPDRIEQLRLAFAGAFDNGGLASLEASKKAPGILRKLLDSGVEIKNKIKKQVRGGSHNEATSTKEYAGKYNETVKLFNASIRKLQMLNLEINKYSDELTRIEIEKGPCTRKFYNQLNKIIDRASEKVELFRYLEQLPQNFNSPKSLTAEEISQGRSNPKYNDIIYVKPFQLQIDKLRGRGRISQVGSILGLVAAGLAGTYVTNKPPIKYAADAAARQKSSGKISLKSQGKD